MIRIRVYPLQTPLARSLYEHLRQDIRQKVYAPHEKLPSKREMAAAQNVSLITVNAAYDQLEQEGYIETKPRQGCYVCELSGYQSQKADPFVFQPLPEEDVHQDPDFPSSLWYKTMRSVISMEGGQLLAKSPNKGCARLRNAIAGYLCRVRGMHVQPGQVIIGSGSEFLYTTLVRMFSRDMAMAIESPGYSQIEKVYQAEGIAIEKLPLKQDGIDEKALAACQAEFLHVTPFHSYPTAITASASRRKAYLDWISKRSGYLIEDDFNSEMIPFGPLPETLFAMDSHEKVIYLNTFSKSLSPSLRLGYMVLPKSLLPLYDQKIGFYSNTVPLLEQVTLAAFIENGSFERHLNRKRRKLARSSNV